MYMKIARKKYPLYVYKKNFAFSNKSNPHSHSTIHINLKAIYLCSEFSSDTLSSFQAQFTIYLTELQRGQVICTKVHKKLAAQPRVKINTLTLQLFKL